MDPSDSDFLCPVCDRQMRLATVLSHAPYEQTFVLQCKPCGLSTTKTVEAKGTAIAPAEHRGSGWTQGHP
jgi:C4-type Zn-finger protein